jgi:hypothetical protein
MLRLYIQLHTHAPAAARTKSLHLKLAIASLYIKMIPHVKHQNCRLAKAPYA